MYEIEVRLHGLIRIIIKNYLRFKLGRGKIDGFLAPCTVSKLP